MKRLLFSISLISLGFNTSAQNDNIIIGVINDQYALWDDTNLGYAKKLSEGIKGDSCLIFGSLKSATGSVWLKVVTIDTVGYIMAEFVTYNKSKLKPISNTTVTASASDYIKTNKENWIIFKDKIKQERLVEAEKKKKELREFISKNDFFVLSYSFPETEYLKYPGFKVSIYNPKQTKTIKYLWFTLIAYNAVDDIEGTKTVQAIGPVEPLNTAEYNFETVFLSKVVDYCKISAIKIQYIDGSTVIFNKSQIETILLKSKILLSYLDNSSL